MHEHVTIRIGDIPQGIANCLSDDITFVAICTNDVKLLWLPLGFHILPKLSASHEQVLVALGILLASLGDLWRHIAHPIFSTACLYTTHGSATSTHSKPLTNEHFAWLNK